MATKTKKTPAPKKGRRAVIVGGLRSPFAKAFSELVKLDTINLGTQVSNALVKKLSLPREEIDSLVWGGVILPPMTVNIGREIALDMGLNHVEAFTCTRACTSGLQAITIAAANIERGDADIVIAGGSDSTSNAPVALPPKITQNLGPLVLGGKASAGDYMAALAQLMPISEILPRAPKIAERTTGEVMGESAERMAERNEISREAQDALAAQSHKRAAAAMASGRFDDEVTPIETEAGPVSSDTLVRANTSEEKLAKLRPVFAKEGTVTAGNASPLTDGAAATVLMSEEKAKALGYTPLAYIRSCAYAAVDPADQLLIGPAMAMPKALDRAGMKLSDIDIVDMHEAFAAQVLSVIKALGSDGFAKSRLGRDSAVGDIDPTSINLHGGSIAIGHPFGATGARMVTTMTNELVASGKNTALLGICAAGGLAAAAVLERA